MIPGTTGANLQLFRGGFNCGHQLVAVARDRARVPASGLGRRSAALRGPLEGWLMASSGLGPLRRLRRRAALGRGCGRGGQRGAAAAEGGRRVSRLEAAHHEILWRYCGGIGEIQGRYRGDVGENRAAAVSTGLRVLFWTVPRSVMKVISWYLVRVRVRIPNRVRVMPRWPRCAKGVERLCLGA